MSKPTLNGFLGGRVQLWQPARGFRSGSDAVLLAAACPALAGESVLDLGCGVGTAMLCVAARVPGVRVTGVELGAVEWAERNLTENSVEGTILCADITDPPGALRAMQVDHVICNPPYFTDGSPATDPAREAARRGIDLAPWLDLGCRSAGPKGSVTFITRADRVADLVVGMAPRLGGLVIQPIAARAGEDAGRVIVQGRKGARAAPTLRAPLVMHDGDNHTARADDILREAAALRLR